MAQRALRRSPVRQYNDERGRAASPAAPTNALLYIGILYSLHVVDNKLLDLSTSRKGKSPDRTHDGIEMHAGRGLKALLRHIRHIYAALRW